MRRPEEGHYEGIENASQSLPDGLDSPYGLLVNLNQLLRTTTAEIGRRPPRLVSNRTVTHAIVRVFSALKLLKPAGLVVSESSKK